MMTGKEALIALANGEEVQHFNKKMATFGNLVKDEEWGCCDELTISDFNSDLWAFRLKPRTITINGIEVPAPFKPKAGEQAFYITAFGNYDALVFDWQLNDFGYWRTEGEIKQVVAALRSIFK